MISDDLYAQISEKYPGREVPLDVSKDGENGAPPIRKILKEDMKCLFCR